jgi:hypothetical protein
LSHDFTPIAIQLNMDFWVAIQSGFFKPLQMAPKRVVFQKEIIDIRVWLQATPRGG